MTQIGAPGSTSKSDSNDPAGTIGIPNQGLTDMALLPDSNHETAPASYDFGFRPKLTGVLLESFTSQEVDGAALLEWTLLQGESGECCLFRTKVGGVQEPLNGGAPIPANKVKLYCSVPDDDVLPGVTYLYRLEFRPEGYQLESMEAEITLSPAKYRIFLPIGTR